MYPPILAPPWGMHTYAEKAIDKILNFLRKWILQVQYFLSHTEIGFLGIGEISKKVALFILNATNKKTWCYVTNKKTSSESVQYGFRTAVKGSNPPPVRVFSNTKNCNANSRLRQRVWKQLFYYLGSHGNLGSTPDGRITLLRILKSPSANGQLERQRILAFYVIPKHLQEAEQMLIEACDVLIAATSEDLGGAA